MNSNDSVQFAPMDKLLFITFLLLLSSSLNAQSMIIAHQEIAPDEAVLPLGVFSTNSMGLHMEDSLSMVLRNLYALYGEPISDDQISLKHNPLFRLQVVSRMPRPISHYIEHALKRLLQDYFLSELMENDTLIDVIVITGLEEERFDKLRDQSGPGLKSTVFDSKSLSTLCWKLINKGVRVKVSDKLLLNEKIFMNLSDEVFSYSSPIEKVVAIMKSAGVICSIKRLPVQKISD